MVQLRSRAKKSAGQTIEIPSQEEISLIDDHKSMASPLESLEGSEAAMKYLNNCRLYNLAPDPNVVITLKTDWSILRPNPSFGEGGMLALMGVLDKISTVTNLDLSGVSGPKGYGNSNARALRAVLEKSDNISHVDLSGTGLDDDGLFEIAQALKNNKSVTSLNLSGNRFAAYGAKALRKALLTNKSLHTLDVSRNALGFPSISALQACCVGDMMPNRRILTTGNYIYEEVLNAVTHGVAFLISILGAIVLIATVNTPNHTDYHYWSCFLFSLSLMFLLLSSTLYHALFMISDASHVLQILDHVGIYMLIAGSYSPVMLVAMYHCKQAQLLHVMHWILVFIGTTIASTQDLNAKIITVLEVVLFVIMGCSVFLIWPAVVAAVPADCLRMILIEGAVYLTGIGFFAAGEHKPIFHVVWHVMVVIAATLHWFAVYFYIIHIEISPLPEPFSARAFMEAATNLIDNIEEQLHVNV
jgi:hemolysin III